MSLILMLLIVMLMMRQQYYTLELWLFLLPCDNNRCHCWNPRTLSSNDIHLAKMLKMARSTTTPRTYCVISYFNVGHNSLCAVMTTTTITNITNIIFVIPPALTFYVLLFNDIFYHIRIHIVVRPSFLPFFLVVTLLPSPEEFFFYFVMLIIHYCRFVYSPLCLYNGVLLRLLLTISFYSNFALRLLL